METMFKIFALGILVLVVFLFIKVSEAEKMRAGLYQACIDDKQPAYACYGFIYGGGVRR